MSKLRINDLESLDTGASVGVDVLAGVPAELDRRVIYVDTIADLQALNTSWLVDGQQVQVKEYAAGEGAGGGEFYWDATSAATDNGGTIFQVTGVTTGRWKRAETDTPSVSWFGASGVADDAEKFQSAIDYCVSRNLTEIAIKDVVYYIGETLVNRSNVTFVGPGTLTGPGAYKCRVVKSDTPPVLPKFGFSASRLPQMARETVNVVIVGDSLTQRRPNVLDSNDTFYAHLIRKMRTDNPDAKLNFYNRGIGGQVFGNLDGTAGVFPDWYTDTGRPWLDYVEDLSPDIVIVAMGMNGGSFDSHLPATIQSIIGKVQAMPTSPGVILGSTPVPSSDAGDATLYDQFSTKEKQELRNYAAGMVRHIAEFMDIPLLDFNRQTQLVRDGFDVRESYSVRVSGAALDNGRYVADRECRNWSATLAFDSNAAYTPTPTLAAKVGSQGTEVVFIKSDAGKLKLEFYKPNNSLYKTATYPNQTIPTGAHELKIEVYDGTFRAYIVGSSEDDIPDPVQMITGGDLYTPKIGNFEGGWIDGRIDGLSEFNYGEHVKYSPIITDDEMWGVPDGTVTTHLPYGGNGVNHPTSIGAKRIYGDTIDLCDFSADRLSIIRKAVGDAIVDYQGGKVIRMSGREVMQTTGAAVNADITWPVSLSGEGVTNIRLSHSVGINSDDLDAAQGRAAQSLVTFARPTATGVEAVVHSLTEPQMARFIDWSIEASY